TNYADYENRLHVLRDEMTARINALYKDIHHHEQAVEKDFSEQATQNENNDVLTSLDHEARIIVQQIDRALLSIKENSYGTCNNCGNPIAEKRLQAVPYVTMCIECAEQLGR
ncbi:TraR/DksA family transcriptional regulator, partial [Gammaproteobacteria bacterium]|nr:TraR/DksA family transcriptional regulator [Gammaproteobacteria bacterium]